MILFYVLLSVVLLALYEYLGHRFILHNSWLVKNLGLSTDHHTHHKYFANHFEGEEKIVWYDAIWVRTLFGLFWSSLLMIPIFIWMSSTFAITFIIMAAIHAGFWQYCHNQMHRPTWKWFNDSRWFKFIRDFHYIHHMKPRHNFAFLFAPVCDWFFVTYRR